MPSFRWSAVNPGGDVARGVMEAPDRAAVVERLQRQGQIVLRADLAAGRGGWADFLQVELGRSRGLDKASLGEVTRELSIMLAAGQDLDRALRFVVENTRNARARVILGNVRDKVRSGSSLAAALAAEPRSFSKLYVGLVRAGEAGGTLPATLDRLATLLERERSLSANLRSALIYPALLIVAAIGSILLLLDYVLPQFTPIFEQAGAELPAATRVLMTVGTVVGALAPWLFLALLAGGLIVRQLLMRPAYRLKVDRVLLRLPVAGGLAARDPRGPPDPHARQPVAEWRAVDLGPRHRQGCARQSRRCRRCRSGSAWRKGRRRARPAARRRRRIPGADHPPAAAR